VLAAALAPHVQAQQPAPSRQPRSQLSQRRFSRAASALQTQQPPRHSQADQRQTVTAPTIVRLGVNEVNLIFTVTDKHGHYIPNLRQSDFALLDDGKAPER
jgi:Ca-activated chloride channel family protein